MKRLNNLYQQIISIDNLTVADTKAQKGKSNQYGVVLHNKKKVANIEKLHRLLLDKQYSTSVYDVFKVYEPKERIVYRLPYFPDRITHHAIMNVLEPIFEATFTADTYSCIKGRGIHAVVKKLKRSLKDTEGAQYCMKMDITKFYPSVNHSTLKALLRKKFKDQDLLWLLDEIIDSADGLPIGNYLSQFLANFYLSYFDHWIKEQKGVKYYYRYADDIVILADNKPYLHQILADIKEYLSTELQLAVKDNYQVFPVSSRGIDFVGYVFYHTHVRIRKHIKQSFARKLSKNINTPSMASYKGWLLHCNALHLTKKLLPNEKF